MVSLGTFQILKVMQHLRNVNLGLFSYCWTICLAIFIVTVILCCSKPPVLSPHKSLLCRLDQNNLSSLGFPFIDLNPSMTLEACIWPPAFSPSYFSFSKIKGGSFCLLPWQIAKGEVIPGHQKGFLQKMQNSRHLKFLHQCCMYCRNESI